MQKGFTDFQHCRRITTICFTLFLLLPLTTVAQTAESQRTVVLVSMMELRSALYWSRGEERIASELKMSDLNVITYAGSPFAAMHMEAELQRAAESEQANVAIFLYKTSEQNVRLMIYTKSKNSSAPEYTTYDFQLDTTEESEDIVALKAAEAVLAVMKIRPRTTGTPPDTPKTSIQKLALILAISGVISVGVGIGFHYQKSVHEEEATKLSNQIKNGYQQRVPLELDARRLDYNDSMDATKSARARAIAAYALGGALLTVSAVILSYRRLHSRKKASASISLQGTGVIWEF